MTIIELIQKKRDNLLEQIKLVPQLAEYGQIAINTLDNLVDDIKKAEIECAQCKSYERSIISACESVAYYTGHMPFNAHELAQMVIDLTKKVPKENRSFKEDSNEC